MEEKIAAVLLKHFPGAQAAWLFGSFGTEYERPDSDVDIGLLLPEKAGTDDIFSCRFALEEILSRPVDLVDLRGTNTVFQFEVARTGRPLFIADRTAANTYEMLVISFYQKLQQERAGILEAVKESGRILQ